MTSVRTASAQPDLFGRASTVPEPRPSTRPTAHHRLYAEWDAAFEAWERAGKRGDPPWPPPAGVLSACIDACDRTARR